MHLDGKLQEPAVTLGQLGAVLGEEALGELDRVLGDLSPVVHPRPDLRRARRARQDLAVELVPSRGFRLAALEDLGVVGRRGIDPVAVPGISARSRSRFTG